MLGIASCSLLNLSAAGKAICDDARLDGDRPALDIYFEASVEVAGGIDNHPITNSVAGHRSATTAADHAPPTHLGHVLSLIHI